MSSEAALIVVLAVAGLVVPFGLWRRHTDGRAVAVEGVKADGIDTEFSVAIVQFSSAICSACTSARRVLGAISAEESVTYTDIDVEMRPDLVERFDVRRTPTVLVLSGGQVDYRMTGVPRREELIRMLTQYRQETGSS